MRASGLLATCFALSAISSVANAAVTLIGATPADSFRYLSGTGFGAAPRMLSLQRSPIEIGGVTPVNVVNGDAISGANFSSTPTLSALGWNSGANVGIGFIPNQSAGTGITMNSLMLTIYNGTTSVGSFSLSSPINFSASDLALQQGQGTGNFEFVLTSSEQTTFNSILGMSGSSGFFAGLSSSLGCPATGAPVGCMPANAGHETFLGFASGTDSTHPTSPIPEPGNWALMLLGFGGIGAALRLKRRSVVHTAAA